MISSKKMLRVAVGVLIGVFITQKYDIPKLETIFRKIQDSLEEYEKPPLK